MNPILLEGMIFASVTAYKIMFKKITGTKNLYIRWTYYTTTIDLVLAFWYQFFFHIKNELPLAISSYKA